MNVLANLHTVSCPNGPTPLVLSEQDIAQFQHDGAILLKGFYAAEDYREILHDLADRLALLEEKHGLPVGDREGDIQALSQRMIALESAIPGTQSILYDAMSLAPSIHQFSVEKRLMATIQQILSPILSMHNRKILLMSLPANEWHLATWHQDWYYNKGPISTLTVYAPLQRTTEENGSLLMALGQHQKGALSHGYFNQQLETKWHHLAPETVSGFERVISTRLEVGDILLFSSMVPHCAQLNRSQDIRFVVNLRYQDLTDPGFMEDGWRVQENVAAHQALARKKDP